jgi:hypothetical protein
MIIINDEEKIIKIQVIVQWFANKKYVHLVEEG